MADDVLTHVPALKKLREDLEELLRLRADLAEMRARLEAIGRPAPEPAETTQSTLH